VLLAFNLGSSVRSREKRGQNFIHNVTALELLSSEIQLKKFFQAHVINFHLSLTGHGYIL